MTPSNAVKKLLVDLSSPNCDADMARNLILDRLTGTDLSSVSKKLLQQLCSRLREYGVPVARAGKQSHSQILADLLRDERTDETATDRYTDTNAVTDLEDSGVDDVQVTASETAAPRPKRRKTSDSLQFLTSAMNQLVKSQLRMEKLLTTTAGAGTVQVPLQSTPRPAADQSVLANLRQRASIPQSSRLEIRERDPEPVGDADSSSSEGSDNNGRTSNTTAHAASTRVFQLVSLKRRRLRIRCKDRQAVPMYDDIVTQAITVSAYVGQATFRNGRNRHEARVIARAVDLIFDQFGQDGIEYIDAVEVLVRRLLSVMLADQCDDWTVSNGIEEQPDGVMFGPTKVLKDAQRTALTLQKLAAGKSGSNSATTTSTQSKVPATPTVADPPKKKRPFFRKRGPAAQAADD